MASVKAELSEIVMEYFLDSVLNGEIYPIEFLLGDPEQHTVTSREHLFQTFSAHALLGRYEVTLVRSVQAGKR